MVAPVRDNDILYLFIQALLHGVHVFEFTDCRALVPASLPPLDCLLERRAAPAIHASLTLICFKS